MWTCEVNHTDTISSLPLHFHGMAFIHYFVSSSFSGWDETGFSWYIWYYLAYCTSQPQVTDDNECDGVGGMLRNWSTWRKATPVPLCPPQIPPGLEIRLRQWEAGDQLPKLWHGICFVCHL
jgi:hypothetical protein